MNKYRLILKILLVFVMGGGPVFAQRLIHFAGVDWWVKNGGPYGPGPNYWSDSAQNVWIDAQGRLHLAIRKVNDIWYCSEVYTVKPTTFGEHRFLVDGYIDRMDKNIVLGLFVYADDQAEIDIEYAKWGYQNKTDVGSYTVQPYSTPGNQYSFESPLDSSKNTHFFDWQPEYVLFGSMRGHYYGAPPSSNYYIAQWAYNGADNPSASRQLHTHINFWLNQGQAPQDLSILEVIITDVVQPLNTSALKGEEKLPLAVELRQNFPNPFNSWTTIEYAIIQATRVTLSVFNINGEKIKELVNRRQKPGVYQLRFDAQNLPSGMYFYQLKTEIFTERRKMLIIK